MGVRRHQEPPNKSPQKTNASNTTQGKRKFLHLYLRPFCLSGLSNPKHVQETGPPNQFVIGGAPTSCPVFCIADQVLKISLRVSGARSFWYTMPALTDDGTSHAVTRYSAGARREQNPPIIARPYDREKGVHQPKMVMRRRALAFQDSENSIPVYGWTFAV